MIPKPKKKPKKKRVSEGLPTRDHCEIEGCPELPSADHHWIYTRRAHREYTWATWNRLTVCLKHHVEAETIGRLSFFRKYKDKLTSERVRDWEENYNGGETWNPLP